MTTVALLVKAEYHEDSRISRFVECTTVGEDFSYKTPAEFINAFQKIYTEINRGKCDVTFTIENIIIG